jgi:predicted cobalt transporter CbtA
MVHERCPDSITFDGCEQARELEDCVQHGQQATIVAQVADDEGWSVADGTRLGFGTTLGAVDPGLATTVDGLVTTTLTSAGIATATYRSGTIAGWATVRAEIPSDSPSGEGEAVGAVRWAETRIQLGSIVYLPLIVREYP